MEAILVTFRTDVALKGPLVGVVHEVELELLPGLCDQAASLARHVVELLLLLKRQVRN